MGQVHCLPKRLSDIIQQTTFVVIGPFKQGCGNSKIFYLSRDKKKAKMYLSIENFTCPKEHISLYLTVLKQCILSKTVL